MTPAEEEEIAAFCPYCGKDVVFRWRDGVVPSPAYVLVADWIYHAACWDQHLAEHPLLAKRSPDDPA
jgi:hypothetical protein